MAKITPRQARGILGDRNINPEWDFHTLSSTQVEALVAAAKFYKYRKRTDAPGSTARMFFQYLAREANRTEATYEFEVQGNYAHGWECVTAETTCTEALARLKEYRENEAGTAFRLRRVRVTA